MAEQDQDKTEQATPFKLREARRRGQVAKSLDLNSFFLLAGALALFTMWGRNAVYQGLRLERSLLEQASSLSMEPLALMAWFASMVDGLVHLLAPFFLAVVVIAVLSNLLQTGPIFSFFPLKPDLQRLNPVAGFKRVFSMRLLFEGFKSLLKLGLYGAVAYAVLSALLPAVLAMMHQDPRGYTWLLLDQTSGLLFKLILVMMIVALLDMAFVRWDHGKKMRMSRREMKEETRRREGDPHVRAKLRELQREAVKRSKSVQRVPEADVLITNPTHIAIALRYVRGRDRAPQVLAKGAGETALVMREMAALHGVPVIENRPLARDLLAKGQIDKPVPESLYEPVARVYTEIYAARASSHRVEVGA